MGKSTWKIFLTIAEGGTYGQVNLDKIKNEDHGQSKMHTCALTRMSFITQKKTKLGNEWHGQSKACVCVD